MNISGEHNQHHHSYAVGQTVRMVPKPIVHHVARWGDDRWAQASWSALAPGGTAAHRSQLGQPIDGRFVIAADATNPTAPSMTHGAYDEGVRAATWAAHVAKASSVVVIGAGFAGLGAASTLRDLGVSVVVLEARDRIGGRAHSVDLGDGVVADAGAAWLQQWPTNSLARLAEQWGIATVSTDFHRPLTAAPDGPVGDLDAAIAAIRVACLASPADASLAEALAPYLAELSPDDRRAAQHALDMEIDLENGASHDQLSAHGVFSEPGVGVDDRWLPGGYTQLQQRLAVGVDIRLGHAVRDITWDADGVSVDGHRADVCICTIPVWLLPEVHMSPGLTEQHRDALAHLTPVVVEKVILRFEERWWPSSESGYLRWCDTPASWGEWLDLTNGTGAPMVAGLIAGDAVTRRHRGRTDEEVATDVAAALAGLARAVGGRVESERIGGHLHEA